MSTSQDSQIQMMHSKHDLSLLFAVHRPKIWQAREAHHLHDELKS